MTRLRIPEKFHDEMPAGDYEVLYVRPAAGLVQIAPKPPQPRTEGQAAME